MSAILNQFSDKIKGVFAFFDRMNINGYLLPLTSEHSRSGALCTIGVLYKNFKSYFSSVTDSITKHIEDSAAELGRPVIGFSTLKYTRN